MKNNKYISRCNHRLLSALFLVFLLVSCGKEESITSKGSFNIESFAYESGACDTLFTFVAGGKWTASVSNPTVRLSTKSGFAGPVELRVEIPENNNEKERTILVTVVDESESNPHVVKIVQSGIGRFVSFEAPKVQIAYNSEKESFTGSIQIYSNIDWKVEAFPAWIESFEYVTDAQPIDGIVTTVTLIANANAEILTPELMHNELILADRSNPEKIYRLPIEFSGFTPYVRSKNGLLEVELDELRNLLPVALIIESNEKWDVLEFPEWLSLDAQNGEPLNALPASATIWFSFKQSYLNTESLKGIVKLKGIASGNYYELPVAFAGTGNNYVNYDREELFDFSFDATAYDSNWNPIENAILSKYFNIYAPGDFTYSTSQDNNAPFKVFILEAPGGIVKNKVATWAGIDEVPMTREAINGKRFELWVSERGQGVNDETPAQERVAMLLILPKFKSDGQEIMFEDLFDDNNELYSDYINEGLIFRQKGLLIDYYFESDLPDVIEVAAAGGTLPRYYYKSNTDALNWLFENQYEIACSWVSCSFKFDGKVGQEYLEITVAKNLRSTRTAWFSITAYMGTDMDEKVLRKRIEIIQQGSED